MSEPSVYTLKMSFDDTECFIRIKNERPLTRRMIIEACEKIIEDTYAEADLIDSLDEDEDLNDA